MLIKTIQKCILLISIAFVCASPVWAAQILLDKPVKAGELTLFPSVQDELVYYFVSDKPRLALNEDGNPQFSFLQYVSNVRSGANDNEIKEGDGGGIVHALVSLSVSEEQLRDARTELRRLKPGARIEGPVVYKSGKFALVSAFNDENGELTQKVVGLGNAPILDGQKAAISLLLTKQGAKILWESFHTPTPDISFSFEMDVEGYQSPKRALIEANFDQIYEHKAFAAGLASPYLAAEIKGAFDDLQTNKAIKLTQVGDDANLQTLITTAYNKIIEMMFSPAGGGGTPSLSSLISSAQGKPGLLDKATKLLKESRAEARSDNKDIRAQNKESRPVLAKTAEAKGKAEELDGVASEAEKRAKDLDEQADRAKARAEALERKATELEGSVSAESDYTQNSFASMLLNALLPQQAMAQDADKPKPDADKPKPDADKPKPDADKPKPETGSDSPNTGGQSAQTYRDLAKRARAQESRLRALAKQARDEAGVKRSKAAPAKAAARKAEKASEGLKVKDEKTVPPFAVVAAFEMKRIRQRGTITIDLNKYTADSLTMRFDENIGDLRRYINNPDYFRQANLDNPLFKQREIVAFVDGMNAADFGEYVNYVTVQMWKQHEGGGETFDEVRIDRKNFNSEGNAFKLLYGFKGDNDRQRWLNYRYKTEWSFFGGKSLTQDWQTKTSGALNLAPPYQRRTVTLEADPDTLRDAEVRAITASIFYQLGDVQKSKQVTLNVAKGQISEKIEFMLPADNHEYEYEINWRLRGNRSLQSGRQRSTEALLFVDELPEQG